MLFKSLVSVFLAAILTENYVLCKFLGICPFLGVSKKLNTAVGMSAAVTFVMVLATAVTYPIYQYLLVPNDLSYLQTIVFILIIAGLVQLVEIVLKKHIPSLYQSLGVYLPLITTNCAILGVTMLVLQKVDTTTMFTYTYGHALINALGAGIGFLVAMVMFAGVRTRMENSDIPETMKGLPITLVAASLVALSFLGFSGFVDKLIPLA
ncbi:MAG: RnfABCDGE type electron transport complex subunit A [Ruminococcaceae bacterium]|nr:RnfABCDGE type electron transport complex subunit A [Oscillospiraceae bacterium]